MKPAAAEGRLTARLQSRDGGVAVVRVELPTAAVATAEGAVFEDFQKKAKWPGFRRGGVPMDKVRLRFAREARQEAIQRLIQTSVPEALAGQAVEPVASPVIDDIAEGDGGLSFRITAECAPLLERVDWKGLSLEDPGAAVDEGAVELFIEEQRRAAALWHRAARIDEGLDLVIEVAPAGIDARSRAALADAAPWRIEWRSPAVDPAVRRALTGAAAGDVKTVRLAGPDGAESEVSLTVLEIKERVLPPLNDQFAAACGAGDLAGLKAGARAALTAAAERARRQSLEKQAVEKLLAAHRVDVAPSLIEAESRRLWAGLRGPAAPWPPADLREGEMVRAEALRQLSLTYLLARVAEEKRIESPEAAVEEALRGELESLPSAVRGRVEERFRRRREDLRAALLTERVFEAVLAEAVLRKPS